MGITIQLISLSAHAEFLTPYPAPEFAAGETWINSAPLTMADLKGKVVLVDFWAYSCVNCVRTLPHLTEWDAKYRDKGLVIVGVHAPEFDFEKKLENVQHAMEKYGIKYPVALDNDMATWKNFNNQYWPAHYLISRNGKVVYMHYGEGQYDVTENAIRALLGEKDKVGADTTPPSVAPGQTPETYLGYARMQNFSGGKNIVLDNDADYQLTTSPAPDFWSLQGHWKITPQKIIAGASNATLLLHFRARKVFMVMGNSGKPVHVGITLNGKNINIITVDHSALYEITDQKNFGDGIIEIHCLEPGLEAYSFTFGG